MNHINRDILECKLLTEKHHDNHSRKILIETYWNVNETGLDAAGLILDINRDILECKFLRILRFMDSKKILIETYWNVN